MKKFYILLVGLLLTTQAFALNKTQRNVLLGVGAGAVLVYALESHNKYEHQPIKIAYKKRKQHKRHYHKKQHKKKIHAKKHFKKARYYSRHYDRRHHRHDYYVINTPKRYCAR